MAQFTNGGICAFCHGAISGLMEGSHGCCDSCKAAITADFQSRNPRKNVQEAVRKYIYRRTQKFARDLEGNEVWTSDGLARVAALMLHPGYVARIKWIIPDEATAGAIKVGMDYCEETRQGYVDVTFRVRRIHRVRRWIMTKMGFETFPEFEIVREK